MVSLFVLVYFYTLLLSLLLSKLNIFDFEENTFKHHAHLEIISIVHFSLL